MKPKIFQIAETMGFDLDCEDCVIELCGLLVKAFTGAIDAHDSVLASEYAQAMQQVGRRRAPPRAPPRRRRTSSRTG